MDPVLTILSIAGALLVGAISPGPSFVFVARTAIALSRGDGIAAALGMGVGGVVLGGFALLGLFVVLAQIAWLDIALRLLGGLYLLYLAIRLWRGAGQTIVVAANSQGRATGLARSFWLSLATQLSNPKAVVIYGGIFAALLPPAPPLWLSALLPVVILLVEVGWYVIVACAFSAERPRAAYLRSKTWIDRCAGAVLGLLGIRLILRSG